MNTRKKPKLIRLSVVDNHPVIFHGIQFIITNVKDCKIELANQYTSGLQLLDNLNNLNSDVCLIAMCLPDTKGYVLAKKILDIYPEMKIGIYSNMMDREYILNAFKAGALGYLSKTSNSEEIIDFIQTISRGERYIRGVVADIIIESQLFFNKKQEFNITKREAEVLNLIFDGLKNREIAVKLSIAERTVEFHKQNLYTKLEVNNAVDLYRAALRHNLLTTNKFSSV